MSEDLIRAVKALLSSIDDDNSKHGGLQSRDTIRRADECRLMVNRIQRTQKSAAPLDKPADEGK